MVEAQAGKAWWAVLLAAWAVLCVPLLLVDVPPMADYPNHLARMDVIARLDQVPFFQQMVTLHWGIIPDLAIDSFMPVMVRFVPVLLAGRMLVGLILLLHLAGATACATALHGGRTWWSLGAALTGYHFSILMGFLNFDLTLGAGMLLAACWMTLRARRHPAAVVLFGMAATALLFMGHLMGLLFYLVLTGSFEAALLWARLRTGAGLRALLASWPAILTVAPVAVLYPLTGFASTSSEATWPSVPERMGQAIAAVTNYDWTLDLLTGLAVIAMLLACAATRRLRLAPGAVAALLAAAAIFLAIPDQMKGTGYIGVRLGTMLGILAFVAVRPMLPRRAGMAAFAFFAALFSLRMAVVAAAWWGYRTDVANMRALIAPIQPGDRINQLDIAPWDVAGYAGNAPTAWLTSNGTWTENHLIALASIERGAFWPTLFVNPGQQPIQFKPYFQALADSGWDLPNYVDLRWRRAHGDPPGANPFCAFDWLVLQGAWAEPHPETLSPDWLQLVTANRTGALYRSRAARTCAITPQPSFQRAP